MTELLTLLESPPYALIWNEATIGWILEFLTDVYNPFEVLSAERSLKELSLNNIR
ncbi:hypothetical protein D3C87_1923800 [compost metagenome]